MDRGEPKAKGELKQANRDQGDLLHTRAGMLGLNGGRGRTQGSGGTVTSQPGPREPRVRGANDNDQYQITWIEFVECLELRHYEEPIHKCKLEYHQHLNANDWPPAETVKSKKDEQEEVVALIAKTVRETVATQLKQSGHGNSTGKNRGKQREGGDGGDGSGGGETANLADVSGLDIRPVNFVPTGNVAMSLLKGERRQL